MGKRFSRACGKAPRAGTAAHGKRSVRRKFQGGKYRTDGEIGTVLGVDKAMILSKESKTCLVSEPAIYHGRGIDDGMEIFAWVIFFHESNNLGKVGVNHAMVVFGSCIKSDVRILFFNIAVGEKENDNGFCAGQYVFRREAIFYL